MHVILDIDGALADTKHRSHFITGEKAANWEAYTAPENIAKDSPVVGAVDAMRRFQELKYNIVILTGRHESTRDATSAWLLRHFNFITSDYNLVMRPLSNMLTPGGFKVQVMQRLLSDYKASGSASVIFVDADPEVFEAYSAEGVLLRAPECWKSMFTPDKENA